MNTQTPLTATEMAALYRAAEADLIANGQSTSVGGQTFTMATLGELQTGRRQWERAALAESSGGDLPMWSVADLGGR